MRDNQIHMWGNAKRAQDILFIGSLIWEWTNSETDTSDRGINSVEIRVELLQIPPPVVDLPTGATASRGKTFQSISPAHNNPPASPRPAFLHPQTQSGFLVAVFV